MRVGGAHVVEVADPFGGEPVGRLALRDGAVATSGVDARAWSRAAHHLLDPSTGAPAWSGVVSATALAPTAVEAEALAKAALLAGPHGGAVLLSRHGGALILDDGTARFLTDRAAPAERMAA
jgi:thiamine biosynthesis lipoprotein